MSTLDLRREGSGGEAKGDFRALIHHGGSGLRGTRRMARRAFPFPFFVFLSPRRDGVGKYFHCMGEFAARAIVH